MARGSRKRWDFASAVVGGLVAAVVAASAPVLADVGDALLAGRFNTVDKKTTLSGSATGDAMLKVANDAAEGTGITIQVETGVPPLTVNSAKRIRRLNADKVDGHHADEFVLDGELGVFAAGQIRENASIRNATPRVVAVTVPATGAYCIEFTEPPSQERLESSVVGQAGGSPAAVFPRVVNGQGAATTCPTGTLHVEIADAAGALTNARFSFVVP